MIIPADSVLIQSGHFNQVNNSEDSYQNKVVCNDEPITGKQRLTTKTVIISKSVEEFMQRRKD